MKTKEILDENWILLLNTFFGIIGLIIIWFSTHNWYAVVGGFISGLHLQFTINRE